MIYPESACRILRAGQHHVTTGRPQGPRAPGPKGPQDLGVLKGHWVPKGPGPQGPGSARPKGPKGPPWDPMRNPRAENKRIRPAWPGLSIHFSWALCGAYGSPWGPMGTHGGLMVASLLNTGATIKPPGSPMGRPRVTALEPKMKIPDCLRCFNEKYNF